MRTLAPRSAFSHLRPTQLGPTPDARKHEPGQEMCGCAEATHVNPDDRKPLQRPGKHARGRICGCMWPPHREAAMPPCRAPVPVSEACILGSGTPQALVTPFSTVEGRDTHGPIGCCSPHAAAACPVCGPAPRPPAPRLPLSRAAVAAFLLPGQRQHAAESQSAMPPCSASGPSAGVQRVTAAPLCGPALRVNCSEACACFFFTQRTGEKIHTRP